MPGPNAGSGMPITCGYVLTPRRDNRDGAGALERDLPRVRARARNRGEVGVRNNAPAPGPDRHDDREGVGVTRRPRACALARETRRQAFATRAPDTGPDEAGAVLGRRRA